MNLTNSKEYGTQIAPVPLGEYFKDILYRFRVNKIPKISSGVILTAVVFSALVFDFMIFQIKSCELELYLYNSY